MQLTYAEAAKRVGRSRRTIVRWRKDGMPVTSVVLDGQTTVLIDEEDLLAWMRATLDAWPTHQYRMRAKRAAHAGVAQASPGRIVTIPNAASKRHQALAAATEAGDLQDQVSAPRAAAEKVYELTVAELLETMRLRSGAAEYAALLEAMRHDDPACAGLPQFTDSRIDPDGADLMRAVCSGCPILQPCRRFAEAARPSAGYWAGGLSGGRVG